MLSLGRRLHTKGGMLGGREGERTRCFLTCRRLRAHAYGVWGVGRVRPWVRVRVRGRVRVRVRVRVGGKECREPVNR